MRTRIRKFNRFVWKAAAVILYRFHSQYSIPTGIVLSLTHDCNLNCVYCMRQSFKPPEGNMTLDTVKHLLGKMPYINNVVIQGLCEPFLNPETPAIINWLHEQGYFVSFTTNGTISLTGERLDCLRNVDDFVISIDTADPKVFELLRSGARLETVMQNFRRVIDMKRSLGLKKTDNPPMHINAVITSLNFHSIPSFIKMLEPYADDLTYLMLDPVSRPDYSTFNPLAIKHDADFDKRILELRKIAKESKLCVVGLDYMLMPSHDWHDCPLTWLNMDIESNGDIYFCYDFNYVVGNALTESPLKAHNSQKARDFRKRLGTSDPPVQQCHSCNFARKGWQLNGVYLKGHEDVMG